MLKPPRIWPDKSDDFDIFDTFNRLFVNRVPSLVVSSEENFEINMHKTGNPANSKKKQK